MTYKQKLVLGAFTSFILLLVAYSSSFFSTYIHTIINIFAGGRSTSKVYAFLLYLSILFLISIFVYKLKFKNKQESLNKKILIYSIASLFILGFLGLIYFMHRYGFSITDYIATFNNGEFSSTSIAHNHIGKGLFGYILSYFGYSHFESIDAGHAFIGLMPSWFYVLFGINLLTSLIYTFIVFIKEASKGSLRILYVVLYAILSFSVLEHTFDGGLFDPRVPILFVLFYILLFGYSKKRAKISIGIFFISIFLSFIYLKSGIISDSDSFNRIILSLLSYLGVLIVPFILLNKKFTLRTNIILSLFAISLTIPFLSTIDTLEVYRNADMSKDSAYIAIYKDPQNDKSFKLIESYGKLNLYEVKSGAFSNLGQMLDKYNLLDNILPATVPWVTCFPLGQNRSIDFVLQTESPLDKFSYKSIFVDAKFTEIGEIKNMKRYNASIIMNGCLPRFVNVIEEVIKSLGPKTFMLTNIRNGEYNDIGLTN